MRVLACFLLRRRSKAPLAALLYFGAMLFPALGFVNVYPFRYSFVANHFQYLAAAGPLVLLSAAWSHAAARVRFLQTNRGVTIAIPGVVLAVLVK